MTAVLLNLHAKYFAGDLLSDAFFHNILPWRGLSRATLSQEVFFLLLVYVIWTCHLSINILSRHTNPTSQQYTHTGVHRVALCKASTAASGVGEGPGAGGQWALQVRHDRYALSQRKVPARPG